MYSSTTNGSYATITVKFIPSDPSILDKFPKIVHHQLDVTLESAQEKGASRNVEN
jgi:hypothetical protein